MNCTLTVITGSGVSGVFQIGEGEISIGRDSDNSIQIMSPSISRHHARLLNLSVACKLEDTGSSNGTFVNGRKVTTYPLKHGDEVMFGDVLMRFEQLRDVGTESRHPTTGREYSSRSQQATVAMKRERVAGVEDGKAAEAFVMKLKTPGGKIEGMQQGASGQVAQNSKTQPVGMDGIFKLKKKPGE